MKISPSSAMISIVFNVERSEEDSQPFAGFQTSA